MCPPKFAWWADNASDRLRLTRRASHRGVATIWRQRIAGMGECLRMRRKGNVAPEVGHSNALEFELVCGKRVGDWAELNVLKTQGR